MQDPITELDVRNLRRLVVLRSVPEIAGHYADQGRFVLVERGPPQLPVPSSDFGAHAMSYGDVQLSTLWPNRLDHG